MTPAAIIALVPLAINSIQTGRRLFEEIRTAINDLRNRGEIDDATQSKLLDQVTEAEAEAQSGEYPDHMKIAPDPE